MEMLYIAGSGRSGSTFLGNILGQLDGFIHLGEARVFWHSLALESSACGCRAKLRECPFWREVLDRDFNVSPADALEMVNLRNRCTKLRHFPSLSIRGRKSSDLNNFLEICEKFYEGVWRVSGAEVIVDSSKLPSYGLAMMMMRGVKVRVLHLVRDSRAVAHSWSRLKYQPYQNTFFRQLSPIETSLTWTAWNLAAQALQNRAEDYLRIRYEDFAANPIRETKRILEFMGRPETPLPFRGEREALLKPQHSVSGNPNRFDTGQVVVKADEEWRKGMPRARKFEVTALTWPFLLKYGYPLKSSSP